MAVQRHSCPEKKEGWGEKRETSVFLTLHFSISFSLSDTSTFHYLSPRSLFRVSECFLHSLSFQFTRKKKEKRYCCTKVGVSFSFQRPFYSYISNHNVIILSAVCFMLDKKETKPTATVNTEGRKKYLKVCLPACLFPVLKKYTSIFSPCFLPCDSIRDTKKLKKDVDDITYYLVTVKWALVNFLVFSLSPVLLFLVQACSILLFLLAMVSRVGKWSLDAFFWHSRFS